MSSKTIQSGLKQYYNLTVIDDVRAEDCESFLELHDDTDITKSLGLVWDPGSDNFIFAFSYAKANSDISKRSILSAIVRLYDPLGLIGLIDNKSQNMYASFMEAWYSS